MIGRQQIQVKFEGEVPLKVNSKAFKSVWRKGYEVGANGGHMGHCPYIPAHAFWRSVYARYWKLGFRVGQEVWRQNHGD